MEAVNMNTDEKRKVNEAFAEGSENFTEAKLTEVLDDSAIAREKAEKHLGSFFEEFKLLWQLLKDYKAGKYTGVPWKFIAAVGFAVFYLINPFDVIPDVIPFVGYVDDISVFGFVLAAFKSDIEAYKEWKKQTGDCMKMKTAPVFFIGKETKNEQY